MVGAVLVCAIVAVVAYNVGYLRGENCGYRFGKTLHGGSADFWYQQAEDYRVLAMKAIEFGSRTPPKDAG